MKLWDTMVCYGSLQIVSFSLYIVYIPSTLIADTREKQLWLKKSTILPFCQAFDNYN